jgi:hypothetical protein
VALMVPNLVGDQEDQENDHDNKGAHRKGEITPAVSVFVLRQIIMPSQH